MTNTTLIHLGSALLYSSKKLVQKQRPLIDLAMACLIYSGSCEQPIQEFVRT